MAVDQTLQRGGAAKGVEASLGTLKHEEPTETLPLQLQQATPPKERETDFQVLSVLGEGGMGRVELARQLALAREVALKRVKPERRTPHAEELLRREAIYTGALEHPNIIPVHGLTRDEHGSFVLVMKRVEGFSWRSLLREKEHPLFGNREPLVFHIETLMQVCTAIHFAHTKGIIHRDIKPENVMLGSFGEIYVADWGIARAVSEQPGAKPAGTPAYMSPEMTRGESSVASDIYLLGACLYEILMGEPPHQASSVAEAMQFAAEREPIFHEGAPRELVEICKRAMNKSPEARDESAAQLRDDLSAFLQHRGSLRLTEEAASRFREALAAEAERRKLLIESRFGLQQALREWPQNVEAKERLDECIAAFFHLELRDRNARAAEHLLSELSSPEAGQREALASLQRQLADEALAKERLAKLEHDKDLNVARRPKMFLSLGVIAFNIVMVLGLRELRLQGAMRFTAGSSFRISLVIFLFVGGVLWLGRAAFFKNQASRQFSFSILALAIFLILHRGLNLFIERPIELVYTDELFWIGAIFGVLSLFLFRWLAAFGALAMLAAVLSLSYPSYTMELMGLALGSPFWALAVVWSKPSATKDA